MYTLNVNSLGRSGSLQFVERICRFKQTDNKSLDKEMIMKLCIEWTGV